MNQMTNQSDKKRNSCYFRTSESHWDGLRKFSKECKRKDCSTSVHLGSECQQRPLQQFCTGSSYKGTWGSLGMNGVGIYRYPNGVEYEGEFLDGEFHGAGKLRYPSGIMIRGEWVKGLLVERSIIFDDEVEHREKDWKYCKKPDRRFSVEYKKGLQPAGASFLSADQPTKPIPEGHYDTGDGLYDPKTQVIYSYDLTSVVRSPAPEERKWIVSNCRTSPAKRMGPSSYLYEEWMEPKTKLEMGTALDTPSLYHAGSSDSSTHDYKSFNNEDDFSTFTRHSTASSIWGRRQFITFDPTIDGTKLN